MVSSRFIKKHDEPFKYSKKIFATSLAYWQFGENFVFWFSNFGFWIDETLTWPKKKRENSYLQFLIWTLLICSSTYPSRKNYFRDLCPWNNLISHRSSNLQTNNYSDIWMILFDVFVSKFLSSFWKELLQILFVREFS